MTTNTNTPAKNAAQVRLEELTQKAAAGQTQISAAYRAAAVADAEFALYWYMFRVLDGENHPERLDSLMSNPAYAIELKILDETSRTGVIPHWAHHATTLAYALKEANKNLF